MRQTNMAIVYVARRRGQHGLCHAQSPAHVLLCATVCACAAVRYRMRARPAARVHSYSPEHYHTYGELELSQPSACREI